jgi:hypothetical protein
VKYKTQRISTIAVISQPAPMAIKDARGEKIPSLVPITANTIATEPKTDIWKRFIEIASLARVCNTPRIRKSCRNMANHSTPTEP